MQSLSQTIMITPMLCRKHIPCQAHGKGFRCFNERVEDFPSLCSCSYATIVAFINGLEKSKLDLTKAHI